MPTHILDSINMERLGKELQRARKRKGLTQEEAAKLINASRTTMIAIEQGKRRIKSGELIKLAHAYGQQVHDFVRQRPDIEPLDVQFRGPFIRTESDHKEIEPVIAEFEDLCRNYLELELITHQPLPRKYPIEYQTASLPVEAASEAIALEERNRLNLGDGPIPNLRRILEQEVGLRIFYMPMPPQFSELYAYTDELGGCLAINRLHRSQRQLWSMAHGYFHFLASRLHSEVYLDDRYQRQPEIERFADAFARHFLMPASGLIRRFNDMQQNGDVTARNLSDLATKSYGVSPQALTLRLEAMRLLPSGTWERIKNLRLLKILEELEPNPPTIYNQKFPSRYVSLAAEAFDEGLITEGQFAQFLEVDRLEARRLVEKSRQDEPYADAESSSQANSDDGLGGHSK